MNAFLRIPVGSIDIPADRLRLVDRERVAELVQSMLDAGQITPIEVTPADADGRHRVIAGAHRVVAARIAELSDVAAMVFDGSADEIRLHEIDENLYRHELTPLDQAAFLAERRAIHERLHGPIGPGRPSKGDNSAKLAQLSFLAETALKFSLPPRTVQRALARFSGLSEANWRRLRGSLTAQKGAELDTLIRLDEGMQDRVIDLLLAEDGPKSVAAALHILNGSPAKANKSRFDQFLKLYDGMTTEERERVRTYVNGPSDQG